MYLKMYAHQNNIFIYCVYAFSEMYFSMLLNTDVIKYAYVIK